MKSRLSTITTALVVVVGLAAALGLRGAPEPAGAAGTEAETGQELALRVTELGLAAETTSTQAL